ncbi:MAG: SRPBCC family protein [Hyphomicrobiales bacterium]|nr:SRPBCC family protein [Hyphomicrobiales bacterium]
MTGKSMLELSTPSPCELTLTRRFAAPRDLVWRAYTEPDLVKQWLTGPPGHSMPVCEIDLKPGGKWRYVWRLPNGDEMGSGGTFRDIQAPDRIVHTERFDEDWTGGETLVTIVFEDAEGGTEMAMTVRYNTEATRDSAISSGMPEGIAHSYDSLDKLLNEIAP